MTTPDLMLAVLDRLDRLGTAPAWIARAHALGVRISEVQATSDRVYLYCPTATATGEVLWRPYLGDGRLTLYTHADGPIRPDGVA